MGPDRAAGLCQSLSGNTRPSIRDEVTRQVA
nr:MAG TPA: hypothetical protein [Caudoviricetes sp.]